MTSFRRPWTPPCNDARVNRFAEVSSHSVSFNHSKWSKNLRHSGMELIRVCFILYCFFFFCFFLQLLLFFFAKKTTTNGNKNGKLPNVWQADSKAIKHRVRKRRWLDFCLSNKNGVVAARFFSRWNFALQTSFSSLSHRCNVAERLGVYVRIQVHMFLDSHITATVRRPTVGHTCNANQTHS